MLIYIKICHFQDYHGLDQFMISISLDSKIDLVGSVIFSLISFSYDLLTF